MKHCAFTLYSYLTTPVPHLALGTPSLLVSDIGYVHFLVVLVPREKYTSVQTHPTSAWNHTWYAMLSNNHYMSYDTSVNATLYVNDRRCILNVCIYIYMYIYIYIHMYANTYKYTYIYTQIRIDR